MMSQPKGGSLACTGVTCRVGKGGGGCGRWVKCGEAGSREQSRSCRIKPAGHVKADELGMAAQHDEQKRTSNQSSAVSPCLAATLTLAPLQFIGTGPIAQAPVDREQIAKAWRTSRNALQRPYQQMIVFLVPRTPSINGRHAHYPRPVSSPLLSGRNQRARSPA